MSDHSQAFPEPSPPQTFMGRPLPLADQFDGYTFHVPLPRGTVVEGDVIYRRPFTIRDVEAATMPDPILPRVVLTKRRWRNGHSEWLLWALGDILLPVGE